MTYIWQRAEECRRRWAALDAETQKACEAYYERRHWGVPEQLRPVRGMMLKKFPLVLFYLDGDMYPWVVEYAGSGHYFKTEAEAMEWIAWRRKPGRRGPFQPSGKELAADEI